MKVSRFTIARLYNIGHYEHVRYELTIDIAPEDSPRTAFVDAERILSMLDPRGRLYTQEEIDRERKRFEEMRKLTDSQHQQSYGRPDIDYVGTRQEYEARQTSSRRSRWWFVRM